MNTTKKSIVKKFLIALFAIMLIAALAVFASAEGEVTTVASGYCGGEGDGTNVSWTLDSDGTLTISGEGAMSSSGWKEYEQYFDRIVRIFICNGVTSFPSEHIGGYPYNPIQCIFIPETLTDFMLTETYFYCSRISFFEIDENHPFLSSDENGCIYNKDKSILLHYPCTSGKTEFVVPNYVKKIEWHAFTNVEKLEKLIISENVELIPDSAIWSSPNIKELFILNSNCELQGNFFMATHNGTEIETIFYGYKRSTLQSFVQSYNGSFGSYIFIPLCPTQHTNTQPYPEQPTTCKTVGYTAGIYCFDCEEWIDGHSELPIDPDAHDMQLGECVLETCTTDGYTPWFCTRCGHEVRTDLVPALGHSWDDGKVTREPTCSTFGVMTYTCTREGCAETMTKELGKDPDAHVFKTTVVAPSCLDDGYTSHACTLCRYGYADNEVPALGHTAPNENGDCTRCHRHIQDMPQPEPSEEEQPSPKLNFFQRIIQWFKDLFAKLFKKK